MVNNVNWVKFAPGYSIPICCTVCLLTIHFTETFCLASILYQIIGERIVVEYMVEIVYKNAVLFAGRGRGEGFLSRGVSLENGEMGGFGRPTQRTNKDGWEEVLVYFFLVE